MSKKITDFTKDLNKAFADDGIEKTIKVNELHKWLKSHGYVENKKDKKGDTYRHVTKAGKEIGIKNVKRELGDKTFEFVRRSKGIIEDLMIEEENLVKKPKEANKKVSKKTTKKSTKTEENKTEKK